MTNIVLLRMVLSFVLISLSIHVTATSDPTDKIRQSKQTGQNDQNIGSQLGKKTGFGQKQKTTAFSLADKVRELVASVKEEAIAHRRHLHQYPELSFQEYETSKYIKQILETYGIDFEEVANTGVIATVKGTKSAGTNTVILRADIDALPIQEKVDVDFKSRHDGVMHACGHDFHTANLLAVLKILSGMKDSFSGTVVGVFQPAEEKQPGGAIAVVNSGKLPANGPHIKGVLGLHVAPEVQVGKVRVRAGRFMASSDGIYITIKGKGGHGARPDQNIDPVVIASQLVLSLQQIVSRSADPFIPSVLSFGKVIANGATNVIPDEVYMEGTFRTMDDSWRSKALDLLEKQVKNLPEIYGATAHLEITRGYPSLFNDTGLAHVIENCMKEYMSEAHVEEAVPIMAAEDFAYYTQRYPSVMYVVGVGNREKGMTSDVHTSTFQLDEDAFDASIGTMVYNALRLLEK